MEGLFPSEKTSQYRRILDTQSITCIDMKTHFYLMTCRFGFKEVTRKHNQTEIWHENYVCPGKGFNVQIYGKHEAFRRPTIHLTFRNGPSRSLLLQKIRDHCTFEWKFGNCIQLLEMIIIRYRKEVFALTD